MHDAAEETFCRGSLEKLLGKILAESGADLRHYRRRYVERRIAARLGALGLVTYRQYSAYLDDDPEEYERLLGALTVNVTRFFRDLEVFAFFEQQVLPSVLAAKAARRQRLLRIWSAGCATGEEPYSIAMSVLDVIGKDTEHAVVPAIIGTDIDREALAAAKRGEYPSRQLEQIPRAKRSRYVEAGAETFGFKQAITDAVRFQRHRLFEDPPIRAVDVVFCRNVLIYLNKDDQKRLIDAFSASLASGGYLVLGRSEHLIADSAGVFDRIDARQRVFRKAD